MTAKDIFEAIGGVSEQYIEQAERLDGKKRGRIILLRAVGALAASVALVVGGVALTRQAAPMQPLPPLDVEMQFGGMGFEGYMAYSIDELVNANPWQEGAELKTLPVYKNPSPGEWPKDRVKADYAEMERLLRKTAKAAGLDVDALELKNDIPPPDKMKKAIEKLEAFGGSVPEGYFDIRYLSFEDKGVTVEIGTDLTVTISFDPAIALPEQYNTAYGATEQEMKDLAGYLAKQYKKLLPGKKPVLNIDGGDYGYDDGYNGATVTRHLNINYYDGSGSLAQQLVNYCLAGTSFYCSGENNGLWLWRAFNPDLSQKMGDYPIITTDSARALLLEQKYITSVQEPFPGEQYISKVELIYRGGRDATWMPYYRFYVELPTMKRENGLNTYGAFYVPAVEEQYLNNYKIWDGSFN